MKRLLLIALLASAAAQAQWWGGSGASAPGCAAYSPAPALCIVATDQTAGCNSALTANTGQTFSIVTGTKSSVEQVWNPDTLIKCTATNSFRINPTWGLLLEGGIGGQGNSVFQSEDFSTTWTHTNTTITTDTTAAPDGTTTADTLQSTVNGGYVESNAITSGGAAYNVFVYVSVSSGTQAFALALWDGNTVAAVTTVSYTATTSWQRYAFTSATTTSTHSLTIRLYPGGTGSTGTVIAWGVQWAATTNSATAPQGYGYAATTTAGVGANQDEVSTTSNPWSDYTGSWSAALDWTPLPSAIVISGQAAIFFESKNAANNNNRTELKYSQASAWQAVTRNSSGTATTCTFAVGANIGSVNSNTMAGFTTGHVRYVYNQPLNTLSFYLNGIPAGAPCTLTNKPSAVPDHLYVCWDGTSSSGASCDGYIKNYCYATTLTGCP